MIKNAIILHLFALFRKTTAQDRINTYGACTINVSYKSDKPHKNAKSQVLVWYKRLGFVA